MWSSLNSWNRGNVQELTSIERLCGLYRLAAVRSESSNDLSSHSSHSNYLIDITCQRKIRGLVFKLAERSLVVINRPTDQVKTSLKLSRLDAPESLEDPDKSVSWWELQVTKVEVTFSNWRHYASSSSLSLCHLLSFSLGIWCIWIQPPPSRRPCIWGSTF